MQTKVGVAMLVRGVKGILLVQRGPSVSEPGSWGLPGGRLELTESPDVAALRELYEETRLTASKAILIGFVSTIDEAAEVHWITLVFTPYGLEGSPVNAEPQKHSAVEWHLQPPALYEHLFTPFRAFLERYQYFW